MADRDSLTDLLAEARDAVVGGLTLANLRREFARTWILVGFGIVYVASQITILIIVAPIQDAMIALQTSGFSAEQYLDTFRNWERSGDMAFYRAHFVYDDVHWIWYSGLFTAILCRLFERNGMEHRHDWALLLPLGSGLLDCYENSMQHVFLSSPDFATIVDPLPLMSTLASDAKWLLVLAYSTGAIVLAVRARIRAS